MNLSPWLAVPGTLLASITLIGLSQAAVKKLGRRWIVRRNLLRLACGLTFDRFDALLGPPLTMRYAKDVGGRVIKVYRTHEAYVAVAAPSREHTVDAFSITIRRARFKLSTRALTGHQLDLVLPRARFGDLATDGCDGQRCIIGANRFGYSELYYYGKPGYYHDYVLSHNDEGAGPFIAPVGFQNFASGRLVNLEADGELPAAPSGDWFTSFRAEMNVNTLTVVASEGGPAVIANGLSMGVDKTDVDQIPE